MPEKKKNNNNNFKPQQELISDIENKEKVVYYKYSSICKEKSTRNNKGFSNK